MANMTEMFDIEAQWLAESEMYPRKLSKEEKQEFKEWIKKSDERRKAKEKIKKEKQKENKKLKTLRLNESIKQLKLERKARIEARKKLI